MTELLRLVAGFLFAPMIATVGAGILIAGFDKGSRFWVLSILLTYPVTILVALPAFVLLRRLYYPRLVWCLVAGAVIGGVAGFVVLLTQSNTGLNEVLYPTFGGMLTALVFWLIAYAGADRRKYHRPQR